MELAEAIRIVEALADGVDPLTRQPLAADHVCQNGQIVRALYTVVQELRRPAKDELASAGKPWSTEVEAALVQAFEKGTKIGALARKHGRTPQAIRGRLYRLGKVPDWRPGGAASAE